MEKWRRRAKRLNRVDGRRSGHYRRLVQLEGIFEYGGSEPLAVDPPVYAELLVLGFHPPLDQHPPVRYRVDECSLSEICNLVRVIDLGESPQSFHLGSQLLDL